MESKYVSYVYDRRGEVAKKGVGCVHLVIFGTRECRKRVPVGYVTPDKVNEFINSPEIQEKIRYYESIANYMVMMHIPPTLDNLNHIIEHGGEEALAEKSPVKTIDLFSDYLERETGFKKKTVEKKAHTLDLIREFGKMKTLGDITPERLVEFDEWLHAGGKRTDVSVYVYHKNLKKWCRMAYEEGYIEESPYRRVHFTKGKSKERMPLSQEELNRIINLDLKGNLDSARDMFVFAACTGLSHCDVLRFDYKTMTEVHNGNVYILGSRMKSGTKFFTPILEPALRVLEKRNFHLPHMCDQKVNDYLKIIKDWTRIQKPLTFHIARHTFATLALANGVPVDNVSKMLGHTNLATTQIYAKTLHTTIMSNTEKWIARAAQTSGLTSIRTESGISTKRNTRQTKRPRIQQAAPLSFPATSAPQPIIQPTPTPSYQPEYPAYPEYSGYSISSYSYSYV